ncbi:helix-turn-helix domain-containing protein [Mangrovivirga cuniculi]|nr:helix-turn-helix domain-containing protein [Mangrovivirga cuniculi]
MAIIKIANISLVLIEAFSDVEFSDIFRISLIIIAAIPIFIMAYREMNFKRTFEPQYEKYGDSGVSNSEIKKYSDRIISLIEGEKLYLNPSFKIADLSELSNINSRKISQVINQTQQKNFSSFINDYRLKEVKKRLTDEKYGNLSILGIAQECGFKSGGRFNVLFKEKYGVTPSQYRKTVFKSN